MSLYEKHSFIPTGINPLLRTSMLPTQMHTARVPRSSARWLISPTVTSWLGRSPTLSQSVATRKSRKNWWKTAENKSECGEIACEQPKVRWCYRKIWIKKIKRYGHNGEMKSEKKWEKGRHVREQQLWHRLNSENNASWYWLCFWVREYWCRLLFCVEEKWSFCGIGNKIKNEKFGDAQG